MKGRRPVKVVLLEQAKEQFCELNAPSAITM